jgi:hypothetical protein
MKQSTNGRKFAYSGHPGLKGRIGESQSLCAPAADTFDQLLFLEKVLFQVKSRQVL